MSDASLTEDQLVPRLHELINVYGESFPTHVRAIMAFKEAADEIGRLKRYRVPLRAALERARPCVKESRDRWDLMLLSQRKAPRSNAPHMMPDHYLGVLEQQVQDLDRLLTEIDAALDRATNG